MTRYLEILQLQCYNFVKRGNFFDLRKNLVSDVRRSLFFWVTTQGWLMVIGKRIDDDEHRLKRPWFCLFRLLINELLGLHIVIYGSWFWQERYGERKNSLCFVAGKILTKAQSHEKYQNNRKQSQYNFLRYLQQSDIRYCEIQAVLGLRRSRLTLFRGYERTP